MSILGQTELYRGPLPQLQGREFDIVHLTPDWRTVEELRTGSGGLGVVSSVHSEELEDNDSEYGVSQLTVAYYCPYGYVHQRVQDGYMVTDYVPDPYPQFMEDTGKRIILMINEKPCRVGIFQPRDRERNHTAVINLTTDIEDNEKYPEFRFITSVLYGERHAFYKLCGKEWRNLDYLRAWQNAILGLGAFYALEELGITYRVLHCNDSHPVFFPLHRFGRFLKEGLGHEHALERVNSETWFTNHTVLPAGNRHYPYEVLTRSFGAYDGFDHDTFQWLDSQSHHRGEVYLTDIAMKLAGPGHVNAVSDEHALVANKLWSGYDIVPITNSVPESHVHPEAWLLDGPHQIPDFKRMVQFEEGGLYDQLQHNAREAGYPLALNTDDMQHMGTILIGFARRVTEYKRPGLLFHETELPLVRVLHEMQQVAIAFGGLVHGDDGDMKTDWNNHFEVLKTLKNGIPVFNYGARLMKWMKAGSNIWVVAAVPGWEACGTSQMGAMLNLADVQTTLTGFVREAREHMEVYGMEHLPHDFRVLKDDEWNARYQYDAFDLWRNLNETQVLLRRKDPRTLDKVWNAHLFAREQYTPGRMVRQYLKFFGLK